MCVSTPKREDEGSNPVKERIFLFKYFKCHLVMEIGIFFNTYPVECEPQITDKEITL